MSAEALETTRQPIDRVVGIGDRRVTGRPLRRDAEILVRLLRRLQADEAHRPIVAEPHAPAFVEREIRLQRLPPVGEQPANAGAARLLVAGEREDHVATEPDGGSLKQNHGLELHESHSEVVAHAATDEEAVALGDLVRRARPRLAFGSHDVEVREQQQRLLAAVAP